MLQIPRRHAERIERRGLAHAAKAFSLPCPLVGIGRRRRRKHSCVEGGYVERCSRRRRSSIVAVVGSKLRWRGVVRSIQPRIRLGRSFDERQHTYLGYALLLNGTIGEELQDSFLIGIGKAAQAKHGVRAGDEVMGVSSPVADPRLEPVEYYKTSGLRVLHRAKKEDGSPPPWLWVPPELPVYRQRGHRRLDARRFQTHCTACIWGCRMPVEMIIDHWNPVERRYRFETFCYGPKSCRFYKAGRPRRIPGRKGMVYVEEDWLEDDGVAYRGPDD